jgi:putative membrane protein
MKPFIVRWLVMTLAVLVATRLDPGIQFVNVFSLLGAALLLGICNAMVRPFLTLISLPLFVFTSWFFVLVLNALVLLFVGGGLIPGFKVLNFFAALFGSIVIGLVSWLLQASCKLFDGQIRIVTIPRESREPRGGMKTAQGRVINEK